MFSRNQIPESINSHKLLNDLVKEIKYAEKHLLSIYPLTSDRESKRKKKKKFNQDFTDLHVSNSLTKKFSNNSLMLKNIPFTKNNSLSNISYKKEKKTKGKNCNNSNFVNDFNKNKTFERLKVLERKDKKKSFNISKSRDVPRQKNVGLYKDEILEKSKRTLIRFKLGSEQILSSTKDDEDDCEHSVFEFDNSISRKEFIWKQTTSVYDFNDESDDNDYYEKFILNKATKNKKRIKSSGFNKVQTSKTRNYSDKRDTPKNGIDELLKASAYTSVLELQSSDR